MTAIDDAPASPADGPIPVTLVAKDALESVLEGLPSAHAAWARANQFRGKLGQALRLPTAEGRIARILFGWGDASARARERFHLGEFARAAPAGTYRLELPAGTDADAAEEAALGWRLGRYRFERYKQPADEGTAELMAPDGVDPARLDAIAAGVALARDLINTPACDMGPVELEAASRELAARHGAGIAVTVGEDLLTANFPLIHAVGRAGCQPPRLIEIVRGDPAHPKVTLVGKGVCFDTGGLDIKPSASMALMKKDMGGAASVLGLAHMVMALNLPVRLRVLVPAVENAISSNSMRPGDILRSRLGRTVEINNTDAEGRLVLADALALGAEDRPALMLDMATLTGAARVALGPDVVPFYTDDEALAAELSEAGRRAADPLWRMPLWPGYEGDIEPAIADLDNAPSGGMAGSITAALFLKRFVGDVPWAHFDIYGWVPKPRPGRPKGGEAQAARAVLRVLEARFGAAVKADRRLTPARADLAARHLAGLVEAARFADPVPHRVAAAAAPLRPAPDAAAGLDSELLHGEAFDVYDRADGWAWGQAALDGYVGYVPAAALAPAEGPAPDHRVRTQWATLYERPVLKSPPAGALPFAARVAVSEAEGGFVRVGPEAWVHRHHLAPLAAAEADWVAVAERFLGTPYVWGGRSPAGVDCSGLVQVARQAGGHACPRDSDMQAAGVGRTLGEDEPLRRGDLVFWRGHVAVMVDGAHIVHATGHFMETVIEPLATAVERIQGGVHGPVTRRARLD